MFQLERLVDEAFPVVVVLVLNERFREAVQWLRITTLNSLRIEWALWQPGHTEFWSRFLLRTILLSWVGIHSWNQPDEDLITFEDSFNDSQILCVIACFDPDPLVSLRSDKLGILVLVDLRHFVQRHVVNLLIAEVQATDGLSDALYFVSFHKYEVFQVLHVCS